MTLNKIIILVMILVFPSFSQVTISNVFIKVGEVRNFQDNNDKKYAFFGEAGTGGVLITDLVNWSINIGYWDDGIDSQNKYTDAENISNSCYILGMNLEYKFLGLADSAFTVSAVAGIAYNIKNNSDAITSDKINTDYYFQPYAGLKVNYRFTSRLFLTADVGSYIGVSRENLGRGVFAAGAGYYFN